MPKKRNLSACIFDPRGTTRAWQEEEEALRWAAWRRRRRSRARRRSILGRGFNDAGLPYRVPSTEVEDDLPLVPMAGVPERSGARGGWPEWSASGAVASPSRHAQTLASVELVSIYFLFPLFLASDGQLVLGLDEISEKKPSKCRGVKKKSKFWVGHGPPGPPSRSTPARERC